MLGGVSRKDSLLIHTFLVSIAKTPRSRPAPYAHSRRTRAETSHHGNKAPRPATLRCNNLPATYPPYTDKHPLPRRGPALATSLQCRPPCSAGHFTMIPRTTWVRYRLATHHQTAWAFQTTTMCDDRPLRARQRCRRQVRSQVSAVSSTRSWELSLARSTRVCRTARAGRTRSRVLCTTCRPLRQAEAEAGTGITRSMMPCEVADHRVRQAQDPGRRLQTAKSRPGSIKTRR